MYENFQFKNDFKITIGQVNKITTPGWKNSGDYSMIYEYKINGRKYTGNNNYEFCGTITMQKMSELLVNQYFPVAYSSKDMAQSSIIVTQKSADMFNYKIPDSLLVYDSILSCR